MAHIGDVIRYVHLAVGLDSRKIEKKNRIDFDIQLSCKRKLVCMLLSVSLLFSKGQIYVNMMFV